MLLYLIFILSHQLWEYVYVIPWIRFLSTTKPFQCQHCRTSFKWILFPDTKWTTPCSLSLQFVGVASRLHQQLLTQLGISKFWKWFRESQWYLNKGKCLQKILRQSSMLYTQEACAAIQFLQKVRSLILSNSNLALNHSGWGAFVWKRLLLVKSVDRNSREGKGGYPYSCIN